MGYIMLQGYAFYLAVEVTPQNNIQNWMPLIVVTISVVGAIVGTTLGAMWTDKKTRVALQRDHKDLSSEHKGIIGKIELNEKNITQSVSSILNMTDLKVTDIKNKTEILNERIGHLYKADKRKEINMSYSVQDMLTNLQEQFIQQGKIIKYQTEQIQKLNEEEKQHMRDFEELQVNYRNSLNKITILEKKFIASSERGKELEKELESLKNPKSKKPSKGYDMDM